MQLASPYPAVAHIDFRYGLNEWLGQCAMFAVGLNAGVRTHAEFDKDTINAARSGDEDAFREIVARYQSTLSTQMRRFSRDQSTVEDLVHDVFVEAFLSLQSFKGKSPFEHWLRKIAVRVGYRYWKTEARDKQRMERIRREAIASECFVNPPADATDAREQLHVVLERLSPRDRLVLTLLYWDGHSVVEAAELAGWTQAMVKVQAHRARSRLKKLLEKSNDT